MSLGWVIFWVWMGINFGFVLGAYWASRGWVEAEVER